MTRSSTRLGCAVATGGKKDTSITTVKGGEVKANDTVTGTITCQAFMPAIAEGGDE